MLLLLLLINTVKDQNLCRNDYLELLTKENDLLDMQYFFLSRIHYYFISGLLYLSLSPKGKHHHQYQQGGNIIIFTETKEFLYFFLQQTILSCVWSIYQTVNLLIY
mmetsp:Transcript_18861/g.28258  ORF Transcript_18861/g.28258 Transcript_18861/m.28258 type:complete len:106 (+) Transcript_18861:1619-1936(+)